MTPVRYDAVVVGGGPAGLSAATWLARYRRRVLLLDTGEQRNRWVDHAHGYLGLPEIAPGELNERARAHLAGYEQAELRPARATNAEATDDEGFLVTLDDGSEVRARRLVLATGVVDRFPDIPGFLEHYGADAFHCPTCDGYEARDRRVLAVGWSEEIAGFALTLLEWAASVVVATDGRDFEGGAARREALARHGVRIVEDDVAELLGARGALEGARLRGGEVVECDLVFFSIAHTPASDLAEQLGCRRTGEDCVAVDEDCQTSVPGVYAAGDMTPGPQLVQVAAAKGTVAGVACARSLQGEPAVPGAPTPGPDPDEELPG